MRHFEYNTYVPPAILLEVDDDGGYLSYKTNNIRYLYDWSAYQKALIVGKYDINPLGFQDKNKIQIYHVKKGYRDKFPSRGTIISKQEWDEIAFIENL